MTLRHLAATLALALAVPAVAANKADVKEFAFGQEVTAMAITPDGSAIWFVQAWAMRLGRLDTATGDLRFWPTPDQAPEAGVYYGGAQPYDVVVDDAGDVWFSELPGRAGGGPAYVTRFRPATETFEQFMVNAGWHNGYGGDIWLGQGGLRKGADGKIWFTDKSMSAVTGWIDPATGEIRSFSVGAPAWGSCDVAISGGGTVYVSRGDGIATLDMATGAVTALPEFAVAYLAATDAAGNVWFSAKAPEDMVSWDSPFVLVRIANDGTVTWFRDASRFSMPGYFGQMATDALGHVWLGQDIFNFYNANFTNELTELDPATGKVTTYAFPFHPEFMSINSGQMAASASYVNQPGRIAVVRDLDRDGDGVLGKQDCNDLDASVLPGAVEVKKDGVDQDCNGYDLTIEVTKVTFKAGAGLLRVEATSALGASAALQVTGYGPMKWDALTSRWVLNVTTATTNPGSVRVCGLEGCDFPVAVTAL